MKNKTVTLITGASSGIGYEIAKIFAYHQHNLVLVARNKEKLKELAKYLMNTYDVEVHIVEKDLSKPESPEEIFGALKELQLEVDILVNNAGFGYVGLFHETELQADLDMLQVNINTVTELTKLFAKEMVKQKCGKVLNVASTGSYHPGPFTAVYYATKAYVLSFSEAISRELEPYNVTVTAICPGATKTNFAQRAGKRDNQASMDPRQVAEAAYKALMKNKRVVVPGLANKLFVKLPRSLVIGFIEKYQRKLSVKK